MASPPSASHIRNRSSATLDKRDDVTGFVLLGHLLEICRGSEVTAELRFANIPVLLAAIVLAQQGFAMGAATRNWASYGHDVELLQDMSEWQLKLLCDPQTSGGIGGMCPRNCVGGAAIVPSGELDARVIGAMQVGNISLVSG